MNRAILCLECAAAVTVLAACGGAGSSTTPSDAGSDASTEAAPDAGSADAPLGPSEAGPADAALTGWRTSYSAPSTDADGGLILDFAPSVRRAA
jgi:hypothetical protein